MTKLPHVLLLVALLGVSLVGMTAAGATPPSPAPAAADLRRVLLHIEGMTCGGCALSVRIVLERLEGVEKAEVDYERKRAEVTYNPARTSPIAMIAALKETLGYTATRLEEETSR